MNDSLLLDYWSDRGVLSVPWAGGICCLAGTVEEMAQGWVGAYREGFAGVTIDEFGSQAGQFLGDALIRARELERIEVRVQGAIDRGARFSSLFLSWGVARLRCIRAFSTGNPSIHHR